MPRDPANPRATLAATVSERVMTESKANSLLWDRLLLVGRTQPSLEVVAVVVAAVVVVVGGIVAVVMVLTLRPSTRHHYFGRLCHLLKKT